MSSTTTNLAEQEDTDTPYSGSQLMDLPDGGSVIVDPDNYAAMVTQQPPVGRDRPDDPTDVANDYLDYKHWKQSQDSDVAGYKQFLHDNPDLHRGPRAPSYQDQFRAALAAGQSEPGVGAPHANFRPQPSAADIQDLRNMAATYQPQNRPPPDDWLARGMASPAASAGADAVGPRTYEDGVRDALAASSDRGHAMLNFGFEDPEMQELYGEKHVGDAKPDPTQRVEPKFERNRTFVEQHFAKYRDKDGALAPFYQAVYDNAVAKANAADVAERDKYMRSEVERMARARTQDNMPAPTVRANFAIPDQDATAEDAGDAVAGAASPNASYEDRVRAALEAKPADDTPQAYSPMTAMAAEGLGVPNVLSPEAIKKASAAADARAANGGSVTPPPPVTNVDTTAMRNAPPPPVPADAGKSTDAMSLPEKAWSALSTPIPEHFGYKFNPNLSNSSGWTQPILVPKNPAPPPKQVPDDNETVTGTEPTDTGSAPDLTPRYGMTQAEDLPRSNPERINQITADTLAQGGPAQAEANAMSSEQRAEAGIYGRMGQLEARNASESMLQEQVRRQKVDSLMNRLQEQSDAISNHKIDPDHFWESRSDGQKAALVLSAMLGGFTAGIRGGPNQALEQINKSIDNDIQAQKANIANRRGGVDTMKNELDLMRLQFGDERTAEAAVKLSRINSLKAYVEAEKAKYNDPVFQARAAAVQSQLQVQADQLGIQLHQWINPQPYQINPLGVADDKLYVPGVNGIANAPEDAEDLKQNFLPAYDNLKRILASAEKIRKANGQTDPTEIPELTSLQKEATLYINQLHRMRRMSDADKENNEGMASDFTKILFGKAIDKNIKSFSARLDKSRESAIRNYGLVGGAQGYDQTGVRRTYYTRRKVGLPNTAAPQGTGFSSLGG